MATFILSLLYFIMGEISFKLFYNDSIISIGIFPSEGIALAFALFFGKKVIPGIFIGQFLLAYIENLPFSVSLFISIINSFEALIAIYLFNDFKLDKGLKSFKDIFGLIFLIIFVLQPFSAIFGNLVLFFNGLNDNLLKGIFSWWFGNVLGQLVFTPFLLLLFNNYKKLNLLEFLMYGFGFGVFLYILEFVVNIKNPFLFISITLPIMVFVMAKKGMLYGGIMSIVAIFISAFASYSHIGAFYTTSNINNTINFNLFILVYISIFLMVGRLLEDKKEYMANLEETIKKEVQKNKNQQFIIFQQNRLAQMGEIINMIAHHWKQPLTNVSILTQSIVMRYEMGELDDDYVKYFKIHSKQQINLMTETVDNFRKFFKPENEKTEFILNELIEKVLAIIDNINETYIEINFHNYQKYKIIGYNSGLAQVLLNIFKNSKEAFIKNNIENKKIDIFLTQDDKYVVINVKDNGGGIDEAIIDKVFDPYFSTKKENGAGLGLYMSKMILEHMDGDIKLFNEHDGLLVKIYLPKE